MESLKKIQKLSEKQRVLIFWTVMSVIGLILLVTFILITINNF